MEALKFENGNAFYWVLFVNGFAESRGQMVAETGGSEEYCLEFLRNLSGSSATFRNLDMTEDQLKAEICYAFSFPDRWAKEKESANLALLGSWSYWVKGVVTESTIAAQEEVLKAIKSC